MHYNLCFVLIGYSGQPLFRSPGDFETYARATVQALGRMSFGKVGTYKILMGDTIAQTPETYQVQLDLEVIDAAKNDWPGGRWQFAHDQHTRDPESVWLPIPSPWDTRVDDMRAWIVANQKPFRTWVKSTADGRAYGETISNKLMRMGASAAGTFLSGYELPSAWSDDTFDVTACILNTTVPSDVGLSAGANQLRFLGLLDHTGAAITTGEGFWDDYNHPAVEDVAESDPLYVLCHEAVHSYGFGTHDHTDPAVFTTEEDERRAAKYSVMAQYGGAGRLTAWGRYFWCKMPQTGARWLAGGDTPLAQEPPAAPFTRDVSEVEQLQGAIDDAGTYIFVLEAGDGRGTDGRYLERFDDVGWYQYRIDGGGTLTFEQVFDRAPVVTAAATVIGVNRPGVADFTSLVVHAGDRVEFGGYQPEGEPRRDLLMLTSGDGTDSQAFIVWNIADGWWRETLTPSSSAVTRVGQRAVNALETGDRVTIMARGSAGGALAVAVYADRKGVPVCSFELSIG